MNSEDIKLLLEMKEYILTVQEYMHILWTSPQIRGMEKDEYGRYILHTDDRYDFILSVVDKDLENQKEKTL